MLAPVLFSQEGAIATITLDVPEVRNAISELSTIEALLAAVERVSAAPDIKVAILTGAGPAFSSGGDLRTIGTPGGLGGGPPSRTPAQYATGIQRLPLAFERLDVPFIAAVNGPAIGAGCDLACMCDIRIASEEARFAENFVKVGLIPGDGGAWLLPRAVGYAKACEMAFTGDPIDAHEALACGLVSRVVPAAELMSTARSLAERIAVNGADTLRLTKRLLARGRNMRLDEILEFSGAMQALAHTTPEHRDFVAGFASRRTRRS